MPDVSSLPSLQSDTPKPIKIGPETPPRMRKFIQLYAESGSITEAARVAGIERKSHYRLLEKDPVYRESFSYACRQIGEDLEYSAIQQAKDGNAQLMLNLLKRFLPDEYARVSNGIDITVNLAERIESGRRRVIEMQHDDSNIA